MSRNTIRIFTALTVALAVLCCGAASAAQVKLDVALSRSVLLANKKQTVFLKVGLTGFEIKDRKNRPPANVCLVIDRSGSMSGEKIRQARAAAIRALDWLDSRDILSVVAYNQNVEVLLPATKLTNKPAVAAAIRRLTAGGTTALFAGVSKGAAELRKFLDRRKVNRIILLSDGIANVGPSSPAELGALGASLAREGVSVTTIGLGLGYNEDLMTQLALKSDGNHAFVEKPSDLARVFKREFGDVLSVVAQEVVIRIRCAPGVRPVRIVARKGDITGQTVTLTMRQLYSRQEKFVLLEVEVPPMPAGRRLDIASVNISYANMETKTTDALASAVQATFSDSPALVEKSVNRNVMVPVVEAIGVEVNRRAVTLRDKGQINEARKLFNDNAQWLKANSVALKSKKLAEWSGFNIRAGRNVDTAHWGKERKAQKAEQSARERQQKR